MGVKFGLLPYGKTQRMLETQRTLARKCDVKRPFGRCICEWENTNWIFKIQEMSQ
jgi:hypothetical protein